MKLEIEMSSSPSNITAAGTNEPSFPSVMNAFQDWVKDLEEEQIVKESIRNRVRELEASGRELAALLQKVHHASGYSNLSKVVQEVEDVFQTKIQERRVQRRSLGYPLSIHQIMQTKLLMKIIRPN